MKSSHKALLEGIGQAIIAGDASAALAQIDLLARRIERDGLDMAAKAQIDQALRRLHRLAEDSARGTQRAVDQIRDILKNARSLQTYDQAGRRCNTPTAAAMPQRF